MQYYIYIPQGHLDRYSTLDVTHGTLLSFMNQFRRSPNVKTIDNDNKTWYWISSGLILKEMPLLRLTTKRSIQRKVEDLLNTGLIERMIVNNNQTFYAFTRSFEILWEEYKCIKNDTLGVGELRH